MTTNKIIFKAHPAGNNQEEVVLKFNTANYSNDVGLNGTIEISSSCSTVYVKHFI